MSHSKKITSFFVVCNIFLIFVYLLACLVPYLDAGKFWFIAILGLGFPLLFIALVFFFVGWVIVRSRWAIISFAALLLSWQQFSVVFSLHETKPQLTPKAAEDLRVLQWNVSSWDEPNKESEGGTSYRQLMIEEVKESQADVLCFEEFFESLDPNFYDVNIPAIEKLGYPYHYYIPSYSEIKKSEMGMAIFSKYPIVNTGIFDFGDAIDVQQLIYTDIEINKKVIRVFAVHLQSVRFGQREYQSLEEIRQSDKNGLKDSRKIISKLKRGYQFRTNQADIVRDFVGKSPYPVILCGDFNDVPNSYTYFTIRGNLQDAFLEKGSGIGRTFRFISPTLRIDYIFADKLFTVNQYYRITVPYSDHYGIVTDLSL